MDKWWFAIGVAGWGALLSFIVPGWDLGAPRAVFVPFVLIWGLLYLFRPPAWSLFVLQWATLALLLLMLMLVGAFTSGVPVGIGSVGEAVLWTLLMSVPAILVWMVPLLLVRTFMNDPNSDRRRPAPPAKEQTPGS